MPHAHVGVNEVKPFNNDTNIFKEYIVLCY